MGYGKKSITKKLYVQDKLSLISIGHLVWMRKIISLIKRKISVTFLQYQKESVKSLTKKEGWLKIIVHSVVPNGVDYVVLDRAKMILSSRIQRRKRNITVATPKKNFAERKLKEFL